MRKKKNFSKGVLTRNMIPLGVTKDNFMTHTDSCTYRFEWRMRENNRRKRGPGALSAISILKGVGRKRGPGVLIS